jgi:hypothetical protein
MLGGLALASTPYFIEQGSAQYADVPLSFFFLAVMVLLRLDGHCRAGEAPLRPRGRLALAGIAAGFAVWTKNEGMLFLLATVVAELLVEAGRRTRLLSIFLPAVAPFVLLDAWFRHSVAFPNELFSDQSSMFHKMLDPSRYGAIFRWLARDFLRFGQWWPVPATLLLIGFYLVVRDRRKSQTGYNMQASVLTLALTLAGYFAVYVITPYDLYWHLRFSLNRLFLQIWPCALFLFFLAVPPRRGEKPQNGTQLAEN